MYYYSGIQLIELAKESQRGKPGELVSWNQPLIQRVFNRFFLGCGISLIRRPGLGILKQKGGKIREVGAYIWMSFVVYR